MQKQERNFQQSASPLRNGDDFLPRSLPSPPHMLLPQIQDQQIYLGLASTFLRLASEAGAPHQALEAISSSLLSARGLESESMLPFSNPEKEAFQKRRESYDWIQRGVTPEESQALLLKLERDLLESRERQSLYRCLLRYKHDKSEEIAPCSNGGPGSRKERFRKMVKSGRARQCVESSNFYKFQVNQILQNTYRFQNQCYRTMGCFSHIKTMFGHTSDADLETYSQIFNAILDKSQELIITGGEEGLIKVWHRQSGSLISSLKGHSDFLNKIDTSPCNKYLMSSAGDGLRFFDLLTLQPLGGWKTGSIHEVTSLLHNGQNYFLFGDSSFLFVLLERDLLLRAEGRLSREDFYQFYFGDYIEKDNCPILVISISLESTHLLLGLESGQMLIVLLEDLMAAIELNGKGEELTLPCLQPVKAHHDEIIEMKWSKNNLVWATGAKDGRCCLWELRRGEPHLLSTLTVSGKPQKGRKRKHHYSCTYICWNCTYSHFAAGFQENIEDEDNDRGRGQVLVYSLRDNRVTTELSKDVSQEYGGIRAMDAHPYFPNILLICEADGHILLFDIFVGCVVNTFEERGFHILHPQFQLIPTECHFTKDGLSFIVATEYGSVSIYGYDDRCFFVGTPVEQFLQRDFKGFALGEDSMSALPIEGSQPKKDINSEPRGDLLSIRLQKHSHCIDINPIELLRSINSKAERGNHQPDITLDKKYLLKIEHNLAESALQEQIYSKTFEEIDRIKQLVLFHERERQYLTVLNLTNQKIRAIRDKRTEHSQQPMDLAEEKDFEEFSRGKRKLKRHSQSRRVNYVDDFEYHDSQEEDFNADSAISQDLIDDHEDYSNPVEDEPLHHSRRRDPRVKRRSTRQHAFTQSMFEEDESEEHPVYGRRRRIRDLLDEGQELERETAPKKKQKVEDDSSSQPAFSRLKKHIKENNSMEAESVDCYRCQFEKATIFCRNCEYTQQFCEACSKLRGKKIKEKFSCLICIFLKNNSPEDRHFVSEQSYRGWDRQVASFVPQLEDKVRFFFQGYEEFLVLNIEKLSPRVYHQNEEFRLLPHLQDTALLDTPLCEVVSIQYLFPLRGESSQAFHKRTPGKVERLSIQMLIELRTEGSEKPFWVFFWPGNQYLIPQELFQKLQETELVSKLTINQLVSVREEEMQIVDIGPMEDRFPETIWNIVKVRKTEGKRLRANTKEIQKRVNAWKLLETSLPFQFETSVSEEHTHLIGEQVEQWLSDEDSPFCVFNDFVDFDIYPHYREQIPVGVCLELILKRVRNGYYRGYQSLQWDIQLIKANSVRFNGEHHNITVSAEDLCSVLLALIRQPGAENVLQEQGKKEQKSREGAVNESESLNVASLSKEPQVLLSKRGRKQSSDYEEEENSEEEDAIGVSTRRRRMKSKYPKEQRRVTRSGGRQ